MIRQRFRGEIMERFWLKHYPAGVPATLTPIRYTSLVALLDEAFSRYATRPAYALYGPDHELCRARRGVAGIRRMAAGAGYGQGAAGCLDDAQCSAVPDRDGGGAAAGCTVVNVNPLYTPRELEHQLNDSGAEAIVVMENFASTLEQVIVRTRVRHVVMTTMGDRLGLLKGMLREPGGAARREDGASLSTPQRHWFQRGSAARSRLAC